MQADYLPNSHFALAAQIADPVDLIVFPESSMYDADPRTDPYVRANLVAIARNHDSWVLANATVALPPDGDELSEPRRAVRPDGAVEGTYAKRHLVPFGEYVPFRSALDHVVGSELAQVPRDFEPGARPGCSRSRGRIATLICFESAFGYQVRPLVHDGAQVIVLSTNNRSYRRSANSAQHVAIGQMRAAETGRPVVQAAISGISAVIDADGVVHERTRLFDRTVLQATVKATSGETPYVRYGEWVTLVCIAAVAAALALATVRVRRRTSLDSGPEPEVASVEPATAGPDSAPPADERESTAPP